VHLALPETVSAADLAAGRPIEVGPEGRKDCWGGLGAAMSEDGKGHYTPEDQAKFDELMKTEQAKMQRRAEDRVSYVIADAVSEAKWTITTRIGADGLPLKKKPATEGDKVNKSVPPPPSRRNFVYEKNKQLKSFENTMIAIQNLGIKCRYDIFHDRYEVSGHRRHPR
jgi:hypothetical protein